MLVQMPNSRMNRCAAANAHTAAAQTGKCYILHDRLETIWMLIRQQRSCEWLSASAPGVWVLTRSQYDWLFIRMPTQCQVAIKMFYSHQEIGCPIACKKCHTEEQKLCRTLCNEVYTAQIALRAQSIRPPSVRPSARKIKNVLVIQIM